MINQSRSEIVVRNDSLARIHWMTIREGRSRVVRGVVCSQDKNRELPEISEKCGGKKRVIGELTVAESENGSGHGARYPRETRRDGTKLTGAQPGGTGRERIMLCTQEGRTRARITTSSV